MRAHGRDLMPSSSRSRLIGHPEESAMSCFGIWSYGIRIGAGACLVLWAAVAVAEPDGRFGGVDLRGFIVEAELPPAPDIALAE